MTAAVAHRVNWGNAKDLGLTPWRTVLIRPEFR
jgi:hypothetical protein